MASFAGVGRVLPLLVLILPPAPAAAAAPGTESGVRLIRSTSGSRGVQQGSRYVIEDPRSVFSAATDRQVVVYFEWEGAAGTRHCEGRWKDPSGNVVLTAPLDYQATSRRFGVYWTLTLPPNAAKGLWALEASVDGSPGGTHTFEVTSSTAAPAGPPVLSQAEIYQRAIASVATVERLGSAGQLLGQGPAVALDGDHLATAFPSIEGAATLRVRTAAGRTIETQEVAGWDRKQGWALLRLPGHGLAPLPRAEAAAAVGDRCYVIDSVEEGGRIIAEAGVVGQEPAPLARPRLNSGFAVGSPVVGEHGELLGMVVGAAAEESLGPASLLAALSGSTHVPRGTLVVAVQRLAAVPAARSGLADLAARGEFVRPLSPDSRHVISGIFAAHVRRGGAVPMPEDQKFVFSRAERQVSVFIQWNPQEKKDAMSRYDLYDADNRLVVKGEPAKLKLRPGQLFFTTWTFEIGRLPPAVYRVDLLVAEAPIWRGYLRITE
jgi:hypothetical protein